MHVDWRNFVWKMFVFVCFFTHKHGFIKRTKYIEVTMGGGHENQGGVDVCACFIFLSKSKCGDNSYTNSGAGVK